VKTKPEKKKKRGGDGKVTILALTCSRTRTRRFPAQRVGEAQGRRLDLAIGCKRLLREKQESGREPNRRGPICKNSWESSTYGGRQKREKQKYTQIPKESETRGRERGWGGETIHCPAASVDLTTLHLGMTKNGFRKEGGEPQRIGPRKAFRKPISYGCSKKRSH